MKKYITTLVLIICVSIAIAGNVAEKEKNDTKIISGKVIDKVSGEEIAGAEIKIEDKLIYTDLNGNFSASIHLKKTEAVVKFVSYSDLQLTINPLSYAPILIELESK